MPTAEEFDAAVEQLERSLSKLRSARDALSFARIHGLTGGTVTATVNAGLAISSQNLTKADGRVESLLSLCRQRASACREYDSQDATWKQKHDDWKAAGSVGTPPARPERPSWASPAA